MQFHDPGLSLLGVLNLGDEEDRRLAFGHRFEQLGMLAVTRRQLWQLRGEFEQQLQPVTGFRFREVGDDFEPDSPAGPRYQGCLYRQSSAARHLADLSSLDDGNTDDIATLSRNRS